MAQTMLDGSEVHVDENLNPIGKPSKPTIPAKTSKPNPPANTPPKATQPPANADKKPSPAAKSGKVEAHLTPLAKAKAQKSLESITADIRKETSNIAGSYMRIGHKLWQVRQNKLYLAVEVDGNPLKNVYEYAETAFGFKKSSAANFIAVCEKFSIKTQNCQPTDKIDPAFALFGYSQLSEMLPLVDASLLDGAKPDMTVKELRALRKSSQPSNPSDSAPDADPDESPATTRTVCYNGEINAETWDRILKKLSGYMGKRIQITVEA